MNRNRIFKALALVILIAFVALTVTGCSGWIKNKINSEIKDNLKKQFDKAVDVETLVQLIMASFIGWLTMIKRKYVKGEALNQAADIFIGQVEKWGTRILVEVLAAAKGSIDQSIEDFDINKDIKPQLKQEVIDLLNAMKRTEAIERIYKHLNSGGLFGWLKRLLFGGYSREEIGAVVDELAASKESKPVTVDGVIAEAIQGKRKAPAKAQKAPRMAKRTRVKYNEFKNFLGYE